MSTEISLFALIMYSVTTKYKACCKEASRCTTLTDQSTALLIIKYTNANTHETGTVSLFSPK